MSTDAGSVRKEAAPLFAALGDSTRLGLIRRLSADGPLSITRLSEGSGMSRQAVTRHLQTLGRSGLVHDRRKGREHVYALDLKRLEVARRYLDDVAAQWDAAATRLKAFVENDD